MKGIYADLIIAALSAGYITFVLVFSGIATPVRRIIGGLKFSDCGLVQLVGFHLSAMLRCPFCTGFWVCVAIQAVYKINPLESARGIMGIILTTPAMAILSAFLAFAGGKALEKLPRAEDLTGEQEV